MQFTPRDMWRKIREATNANFQAENKKLSYGMIQQFLGIWIAICIDPQRGDRSDYWQCEALEESVLVPRCFGARFNVSKNRFNDIMQAFRLELPQEQNVEQVYS